MLRTAAAVVAGSRAAAIASAVRAGEIDFKVEQIDSLDFGLGPIDLWAGAISRGPHQIDRPFGAFTECSQPGSHKTCCTNKAQAERRLPVM